MPHLARRGAGCVVNVSSLAGVRPTGSSIPYAVSKAALNHLTRLLANTVAPQVRVNAVAPGLVDTPWTADWDDMPAGPCTRARRCSGRREPDDVAEVVLSLVRVDATSPGEVWVVDGGLALR